jgi:NodT family efflux transporter outer membrane factor (OMF) lipoprotein
MRLTALALVLTLLAGCTSLSEYVHNGFKVGPNYCPPKAPVACRWIDANDPNVISQPPNDAAWWRTFNDPTLECLIQTAYLQNLSLKSAGTRILQARAQQGIAVGGLFPQSQQAYGSYTRFNQSANAPNQLPVRFYNDWLVGANLAWELDFWGLFRRAVEAADAQLDASIFNYDAVLVLLLSDVAQNYVSYRTDEQRLEYARKNADMQRESLRLAQVKFDNGATTKLDVTQGESNLGQTEAIIPPLEAAKRQAANQLCILMGMPPWELEAQLGRHAIPSAPPAVAVGVPADLVRRRPDVRRAERQAAAASAEIGIAVAEVYPHFSINGNIFFEAASFKDLFKANSLAGNVGPSFNWNIFNYGRLVNNIRLQDAIFQQTVLDYQNTVLQANAEAENALVGFLKAQQQVKYLATSARAAEESVVLVRTQYNEGKTDFNRVIVIEQSLTQQQDQLAVAQGSVASNLVQLYRALGGGWQIRLAPPCPPGQAPAGPQTTSNPPASPAPPVERIPPPPPAPK